MQKVTNHSVLIVIINEIKEFIHVFKSHILCIKETKCSIERTFADMQIENYNLLHKDRDNGQNGGGGVAIYIQKQIIYEEVIDFNEILSTIIIHHIKN